MSDFWCKQIDFPYKPTNSREWKAIERNGMPFVDKKCTKKPKKVRCPDCGRRLILRIKEPASLLFDDSWYYIPAHKISKAKQKTRTNKKSKGE